MRLLNCTVTNFGSYPAFEMDLSEQGLALIQGKTGSGKSTIPDLVTWCLFGKTAKGVSVNETTSWQRPQEPTTGTIRVVGLREEVTIHRVRGKGQQSDLFWTRSERPDDKIRGKDLNDTQQEIDLLLGMDLDTYLASSYYSEFSSAAAFFVAPAKQRRALFERLAVLDLPVSLADKASEAKKSFKKEIGATELALANATGRLKQTQEHRGKVQAQAAAWDKANAAAILDLEAKSESFAADTLRELGRLETERAKYDAQKARDIEALEAKISAIPKIDDESVFEAAIDTVKYSERCRTCGSLSEEAQGTIADILAAKADNTVNMVSLRHYKKERWLLQTEPNPLKDVKVPNVNHYAEQLAALKSAINPFASQLASLKNDDKDLEAQISGLKETLASLGHSQTLLDALYALSFDLRGVLLRKAVKGIQDRCNALLDGYFDAELRVGFEIEGSDDLTVTIHKSGYEAVFRQLSKGQRQLLRTCFSVAIMEATANAAGTHCNALWFDESLDGLDTSMKIKAYRLFEHLSLKHSTVMVIDHCEGLQDMFPKRYQVTMNADESAVEELV